MMNPLSGSLASPSPQLRGGALSLRNGEEAETREERLQTAMDPLRARGLR
jgi:hypothetical protein